MSYFTGAKKIILTQWSVQVSHPRQIGFKIVPAQLNRARGEGKSLRFVDTIKSLTFRIQFCYCFATPALKIIVSASGCLGQHENVISLFNAFSEGIHSEDNNLIWFKSELLTLQSIIQRLTFGHIEKLPYLETYSRLMESFLSP